MVCRNIYANENCIHFSYEIITSRFFYIGDHSLLIGVLIGFASSVPIVINIDESIFILSFDHWFMQYAIALISLLFPSTCSSDFIGQGSNRLSKAELFLLPHLFTFSRYKVFEKCFNAL
jgi:hypothetical protein